MFHSLTFMVNPTMNLMSGPFTVLWEYIRITPLPVTTIWSLVCTHHDVNIETSSNIIIFSTFHNIWHACHFIFSNFSIFMWWHQWRDLGRILYQPHKSACSQETLESPLLEGYGSSSLCTISLVGIVRRE